MKTFKGSYCFGSECYFYQTSETRGVKIYPRPNSALAASRRQRKAWAIGLAPKVFSKQIARCKYITCCETIRYGYFYVTEVAPRPCDNISDARRNKLKECLRKIGLGNDLRTANIMRMKNGKFVLIDFGGYSTSSSRFKSS